MGVLVTIIAGVIGYFMRGYRDTAMFLVAYSWRPSQKGAFSIPDACRLLLFDLCPPSSVRNVLAYSDSCYCFAPIFKEIRKRQTEWFTHLISISLLKDAPSAYSKKRISGSVTGHEVRFLEEG